MEGTSVLILERCKIFSTATSILQVGDEG